MSDGGSEGKASILDGKGKNGTETAKHRVKKETVAIIVEEKYGNSRPYAKPPREAAAKRDMNGPTEAILGAGI